MKKRECEILVLKSLNFFKINICISSLIVEVIVGDKLILERKYIGLEFLLCFCILISDRFYILVFVIFIRL